MQVNCTCSECSDSEIDFGLSNCGVLSDINYWLDEQVNVYGLVTCA